MGAIINLQFVINQLFFLIFIFLYTHARTNGIWPVKPPYFRFVKLWVGEKYENLAMWRIAPDRIGLILLFSLRFRHRTRDRIASRSDSDFERVPRAAVRLAWTRSGRRRRRLRRRLRRQRMAQRRRHAQELRSHPSENASVPTRNDDVAVVCLAFAFQVGSVARGHASDRRRALQPRRQKPKEAAREFRRLVSLGR